MTFRLSCILTASGQLLGTGEDTYSTREEAEARAQFYNEQIDGEPYHYTALAA